YSVASNNGSVGVPGSGGLGGTAFLRVSRDYGGPQADADVSASGGNFVGDLGARYGSDITLSFSAEAIQASFLDVVVFFRDAGGTLWKHSLGGFGGSWTPFSIEFHADWTDAQAVAAGWAQGSGSDSFAAVLASATLFALDTSTSGSPQSFGLDSVQLSGPGPVAPAGVPEPASLACAAVGALALAGRRRSGAPGK
ncbi:MAG TPA: PEP-CTERM sorting domain-containing protein, partial [Planctomycetota bacterium]|nr:PEP-CTERM sorting domain-containing protein [Planctomycetota bacterium]